MAIANATKEVRVLRESAEIGNRINDMGEERAKIVLKLLLAAGHVTSDTMGKALDLAYTISVT